jgi:hypothetical protein
MLDLTRVTRWCSSNQAFHGQPGLLLPNQAMIFFCRKVSDLYNSFTLTFSFRILCFLLLLERRSTDGADGSRFCFFPKKYLDESHLWGQKALSLCLGCCRRASPWRASKWEPAASSFCPLTRMTPIHFAVSPYLSYPSSSQNPLSRSSAPSSPLLRDLFLCLQPNPESTCGKKESLNQLLLLLPD